MKKFTEGCAYLGLAAISIAIICTTGIIPWKFIIGGFFVIWILL